MKYVPLNEPMVSEEMLRLRDYWLKIQAGRAMPARGDFDPVDIPRLLPYIIFAEVHHDPMRIRYRLVGTAITSQAGRDVSGQWISEEIYGEKYEAVFKPYCMCAESKRPLALRRRIQHVAKEWVHIEVLLTPLGEDPERPDFLLCGMAEVEPATGIPPDDTTYELPWELGVVP